MPKLPELRLPPFTYKIEWIDEKQQIWDIIRKQFVILTPEEWVRQHFIHLLTDHLHYPKGLFKVESKLKYDKKQKRSDIQVLDNQGNIFLLVECKAPTIILGEKTLQQVFEYNKSLRARLVSITNGLKHYIWLKNEKNQEYQPMTDFPDFLELKKDL